MPGISWDWRTKPVSGKTDGMDRRFDMSGNLVRWVDVTWKMARRRVAVV